MKAYFRIIQNILENGKIKENRTGVNTIAVAGEMFQHDMAFGFPLLTTKYVPLKIVAVELEGFIKGITDKKWYQERGCKIWNDWCNPMKVPYGYDIETRTKMEKETDLGPIYGAQWRAFDKSSLRDGIDQLQQLVDTLKTNPNDRRMIVSAWNPRQLKQMALPPCHFAFQVTILDGRLNLLWSQRSVDSVLGLPFNIASYALLLLLLAKESGYEPGILTGFLADTHIYENQLDGLNQQMGNEYYPLPKVQLYTIEKGKELKGFSIFDWEYSDFDLFNYKNGGTIKFPIAI